MLSKCGHDPVTSHLALFLIDLATAKYPHKLLVHNPLGGTTKSIAEVFPHFQFLEDLEELVLIVL